MKASHDESEQLPEMNNFIYVIGDQQSTVIGESTEFFKFANQQMQAIATPELENVLAGVFAKGEFFPGPSEVLTLLIHEYVGRQEAFRSTAVMTENYCTVLTAFHRIDGRVLVQLAGIMPLGEKIMNADDVQSFYTEFLAFLPSIQDVFAQEAYATDSKLIGIIRDATQYHT